VAEILRVTREEAPEDTSTHWTTRTLATGADVLRFFIWHTSADEIIAKVRRGRAALSEARSATDH
jgi:hypothetical protein